MAQFLINKWLKFNLRNTIIQTIRIIGILGYDSVTKGLDGMRENPLWLVFMITAIVTAYLSMSISADHENNKVNPQKKFSVSLIVLILISTIIGSLVSLTGFTIINGVIMGGILFICGLIPIVYIYNLRIKRQDENIEE